MVDAIAAANPFSGTPPKADSVGAATMHSASANPFATDMAAAAAAITSADGDAEATAQIAAMLPFESP